MFDSFAETNLVEAKSLQNPTRVEAVTSLLCKCVMPVLKMENLNHKSNLLGKATTPMSEYQMENFERMASVSCKNEEAVELHGIVCKLREAIAKLIGDFMNSLQQGDKRATKNFRGSHLYIYEGETCAAASDKIMFGSWCNSGLYDLVFGWGKLAWASVARIILN